MCVELGGWGNEVDEGPAAHGLDVDVGGVLGHGGEDRADAALFTEKGVEALLRGHAAVEDHALGAADGPREKDDAVQRHHLERRVVWELAQRGDDARRHVLLQSALARGLAVEPVRERLQAEVLHPYHARVRAHRLRHHLHRATRRKSHRLHQARVQTPQRARAQQGTLTAQTGRRERRPKLQRRDAPRLAGAEREPDVDVFAEAPAVRAAERVRRHVVPLVRIEVREGVQRQFGRQVHERLRRVLAVGAQRGSATGALGRRSPLHDTELVQIEPSAGAAVDTFPIHFLEALWQRGGRGGATSLPRAAGGAKRGAARKQLAMSVGAVSLALAAARDAAVEWH